MAIGKVKVSKVSINDARVQNTILYELPGDEMLKIIMMYKNSNEISQETPIILASYEDAEDILILKEGQSASAALMNPKDVEDYLEITGRFANSCRSRVEDQKESISAKTAKSIGEKCIESGEWSPARSVMWRYSVSGISRVCSHQLVRHGKFMECNQRSQRSYDESRTPIIVPVSIFNMIFDLDELGLQALLTMLKARDTYIKLLKSGVAKEDARYVLTEGTETSASLSFSPQSLMHLASERLCSRASKEFQDLASKLVSEAVSSEPKLSKYLVRKCDKLGYCPDYRGGCGRKKSKKEVLALIKPTKQ